MKLDDMMQNMHTGRVIIVDAMDEGYFSGHYYWDSAQRETYAYNQLGRDVEPYDRTRFDTEAAVTAQPKTASVLDRLETPESLETRLGTPMTNGFDIERNRVTDEAQRSLMYARRVGKLEGEIMNLRSLVLGMQAGLVTMPDSYPELKAQLAVEQMAELAARVEKLVSEFPPVY